MTEMQGWRAWSLSSRGYFPENVCRHLWKGVCVGDLMALLCDVRWTAFRMRFGGLLGWKSDFESFDGALSEVKKESGSADEWDKVETEFGLVREAVNEAWGCMQGNERELGTQVYSRLFDVDEGGLAVRRYLRSVRAHCSKPWLLPRGRYWARPGTSGNVELLVGVNAKSIAMTGDGSVLAMSVGNEVLVMNVESRMILRRRAVHEGVLTCVCISGDGEMIVSGSSNRTLRRWDGKSGETLGELLGGHDGEVSCVAMSHDGAMILSSSSESVRLWDAQTGSASEMPVQGCIPKGFEIENAFRVGNGWTTSFESHETMQGEELDKLAGWFVVADGAGGSDASSSFVLRASSRRVFWDGPTGVHVLATLPADIIELCLKRVSFRAGGAAENDGESSYLVGAVAAAGLSNEMVCIFHLVTE